MGDKNVHKLYMWIACVRDTDDLKDHLVECGMSAINKRYTCTEMGWSYINNKVSNVKRHKKVRVKDEPKSKVIIPNIDLSSDTDECLSKDQGQIIGLISTGEETSSYENNNEDETNKNDTKIEANQKVKEAIKHDKVGQIIGEMKQAGSVAVPENNKEVKSSLVVREDVEVSRIIRKPTKGFKTYNTKSPTQVVTSDKGKRVEIGT